MKATKHLFCGYYGMLNSGDDALLLACLWGAKQHLDIDKVAITTPRNFSLPGFEGFEKTLAERQKIRGENRLRLYRTALNADQLIFGGGSVLHSSHDIKIKRHIIKLAGAKERALALGVGIGPFKDVEAEKHCAAFLRDCHFVGVRDELSFRVAQEIAPDANVKLTFDLAPQLLLNEYYYDQNVDRKGICVCLCPRERLHGDVESERLRNKKLAEVINRIYYKTGEKITLLDFNGHPDLGDCGVHDELASYINESVHVTRVYYNENPLSVLHTLGTFKLVLGMRLHASILAYMSATPVLSLNYHEKCVQWCEQIGMPEELRITLNDFDPSEMTDLVVQGLEKGFSTPLLNTKTAVAKSLSNWSFVGNECTDERLYSRHTAL